MRVCYLIEGEYWPYFKWFGTAFSRLKCAPVLNPIFHAVLDAPDWQTREALLGDAYLHVGSMHNELGVTATVEPRIAQFFGRPYRVPHAMRYVDALLEAIESPVIRALPSHIGSVDQFADSTDILDDVTKTRTLTAVYDA
jgi:hypothetical protein